MLKRYTLPFAYALLCILIGSLLIASCDSKPEKPALKTTQLTTAESATTISTIFLDSLTISDTDFEAKVDTIKKQNVVFNYYVSDNAVTLHGWVLKKGNSGSGGARKDTGVFNPDPDLYLRPIGKTKVGITPSTYLSNQVILGKDIKKILKKILGKDVTLYFTPTKDSAGKISYIISFKNNAISGESLLIKLTDTNPSPPHQAYD